MLWMMVEILKIIGIFRERNAYIFQADFMNSISYATKVPGSVSVSALRALKKMLPGYFYFQMTSR